MNEQMIRQKLSDQDIARLNWQLLDTTDAERAEIVQRWAAWLKADEIAAQVYERCSGRPGAWLQAEYYLLAAERARKALGLERADEALRIERFVYGPDV